MLYSRSIGKTLGNLLLLIWTTTFQAALTTGASHKLILVFGGNGFIGSETVVRLIQKGHEIISVSRGNWEWDSAIRVKPFITHFPCDRAVTLDKCQPLVNFITNKNRRIYFDFVIDFSGYYPSFVRDALSLLSSRIGTYIYISTDSVYDLPGTKRLAKYSTEDDVMVLNDFDDQTHQTYEYRKRQCEEVLLKAESFGGPAHIILRLPDVIGPRDSTFRWWIYQLWIKLSVYLGIPVTVPVRLANRRMSFVYVSDVAELIDNLTTFNKNVYNEAYNLAFTDTITLMQLFHEMRMYLNITNDLAPIEYSEKEIFLYPSVINGPINVSKAVKAVKWTPSNIRSSIQRTIGFYEAAISSSDFTKPREKVIKLLSEYFFNSNDQLIKIALQKE